jgi:hypothetical protein
MNAFKFLAAGAALAVILTTFRDQRGEWIVPGGDLLRNLGGTNGDGGADDAEPVLGYDGMDDDTLQEWLADAGADRRTLLSMLRYEAANRGRQPVLAAIVDQL